MNLPFTDTFAPTILPMQGPRANEVLGKDEANNRCQRVVTQDQTKKHFVSFVTVAISRSKKRNRMRYMCILYDLSLHYHLRSPLTGLATFWATSQTQTAVADHHSGICLLSISLAHLQRYLLSVLTTTVGKYHMLIISFCLSLQSVPVSVVWLSCLLYLVLCQSWKGEKEIRDHSCHICSVH